jgi:hypothetical protein
MSQADENCNDFFLAGPSAGQCIVGGKTGKHAEDVRCGSECSVNVVFPAAAIRFNISPAMWRRRASRARIPSAISESRTA